MSKKKLSKLLALYLPYVVIGLLATNLGEAWRLAAGKELGDFGIGERIEMYITEPCESEGSFVAALSVGKERQRYHTDSQ